MGKRGRIGLSEFYFVNRKPGVLSFTWYIKYMQLAWKQLKKLDKTILKFVNVLTSVFIKRYLFLMNEDTTY